ncbi:MAG: hypothetical protein KAT58_04090 [candidate division Zixibacteria bacterium]|nr:hypothetical protein [candidate division Zixibacteria bacterium]
MRSNNDLKGYTGIDDAQAILEGPMRRQNWSVEVRDALAEMLKLVAAGRPLRTVEKKGRPKGSPTRNYRRSL